MAKMKRVYTPKSDFDRRPADKNSGEAPIKTSGGKPVRGNAAASKKQSKKHQSSGGGQ